jgi:hypothetical protein
MGACGLAGVDPKSAGDGHAGGMAQSRARRERPPNHAGIREAVRAIAAQRRRFGYRRVGVMLERKGCSSRLEFFRCGHPSQREEGSLVTEICRKAGISQATYFNWKKKYPPDHAGKLSR